ncbi:MAG: HEAT repeat domain-containing protein, partial [Planctomycetales bacterium]|nr:HEAT repeat domain-containing protein [Planctomycetales bacterium]
ERANAKVQAVIRVALGDPASEVRVEACRAAAAQRWKGAIPILAEMAERLPGKDNETAKTALLALAQIGDLAGLRTFTGSAWESGDREVLVTRIFAIRYLRSAESVEWLLSLFTAGRGRRGGMNVGPGGPIFESLESLTGAGLGRNPEAWRDWWKKAKGSFRPDPLEEGYEVTGLFGDAKRDRGERRPGERPPR